MHLTRPKSSKGRSRGDAENTQEPPESPVSSGGSRRPDRALRSRSQPVMWQASQRSGDQVLHMLQAAPAAPPQSLNKYKVLPSIERRRSEESLDKRMSELDLSDDCEINTCSRDGNEETDGAPEAGSSGSMHLAIRAPCGRRFQQHFGPTDTLQAVRASAEARYGASYREAFIQTMDVPSRTFTNLDMTLAQCGIMNRSVLCISQSNDSVVGHE